ncbi:hypothetical protein D1AOALGA4SA_10311 [Olavius algarvensis Delta 1 endosymbiont]|nr:hypothetical protein D1AOALGA4SA_10311 [Olavius algarvensis Delta 1 endosymbiont]
MLLCCHFFIAVYFIFKAKPVFAAEEASPLFETKLTNTLDISHFLEISRKILTFEEIAKIRLMLILLTKLNS